MWPRNGELLRVDVSRPAARLAVAVVATVPRVGVGVGAVDRDRRIRPFVRR